MDQMSIAKLLLVTFPENVFNIYIAFLLTGFRLKLPFRDDIKNRKNNIFKLTVIVLIFSTIQFAGRRLINDIGIYFLVNTILSLIALRFIYYEKPHFNKDNSVFNNFLILLSMWKKPVLQISIIFAFLMTVENIYLPPMLQILGVSSIKEVYATSWINLVLPQIDRFFQILLITILWNYQRLYQNISIYKGKQTALLISIIYIVAIEFSFSYLYINSFNRLNSQVKILFFALILSMSIFNVFYSKKALNVIDKIYKYYNRKGEPHEKSKQNYA